MGLPLVSRHNLLCREIILFLFVSFFLHSISTFSSSLVKIFVFLFDSAGDDYIEERAELTVPAGENEVSFELQILNDEVVEKKEYFSVDLSSSDDSVAIATPTANVTILEDDSKNNQKH